jgi:hypothetical protein
MLPTAYRVHTLPGRLRLRVPEKRKDEDWLEETASQVAEMPGVLAVKVGITTGSLLIHHDPQLDVAAQIADAGLATVESQSDAPSRDGLSALSASLSAIDKEVRQFSLGSADLRALFFLLLVGMAVRQILRGDIVTPAVPLLWYALSLVLPSPRGEN